jgi:hypothetical protein
MDNNSTCWKQVCGDGRILGPSEECDDGNNESKDGCFNCQIEKGWYCSESDLYNLTSECTSVCGDGLRATPVEACDDNNNIDGDGCASNCIVEPYYTCIEGIGYSHDICTCEPTGFTSSFLSNWEGIILDYPYTVQLIDDSVANDSSLLCDYLFDSLSTTALERTTLAKLTIIL